MGYTPTTWETGDTITAASLNKIENGIANVGGAKIAIVGVSATGFSSGSKTFGYIYYAYLDDGTYYLIDQEYPVFSIFGHAAPEYDHLPPLTVSTDGSVVAFVWMGVNNTTVNTTGDISDTPETIYYSWGSPVPGDCYRISGSGTIEFVAD